MPTWTTPKTNWIGTDTFSASDWVRIDGNVEYIASQVSYSYTQKSVTDGSTVLTSNDRNKLVKAINTMLHNKLFSSWNRGVVALRVDYGSTWGSKDLNAIEEMLLNMKKQLDGELPKNDFYRCGEEVCCGETFSVGLL